MSSPQPLSSGKPHQPGDWCQAGMSPGLGLTAPAGGGGGGGGGGIAPSATLASRSPVISVGEEETPAPLPDFSSCFSLLVALCASISSQFRCLQ